MFELAMATLAAALGARWGMEEGGSRGISGFARFVQAGTNWCVLPARSLLAPLTAMRCTVPMLMIAASMAETTLAMSRAGEELWHTGWWWLMCSDLVTTTWLVIMGVLGLDSIGTRHTTGSRGEDTIWYEAGIVRRILRSDRNAVETPDERRRWNVRMMVRITIVLTLAMVVTKPA